MEVQTSEIEEHVALEAVPVPVAAGPLDALLDSAVDAFGGVARPGLLGSVHPCGKH